MTLAEQLRTTYALTSFKTGGSSVVLLAINEALEIAADIADQEHSPLAASRIRSLKWLELGVEPDSARLGRDLPSYIPPKSTVAS